jgi:hypothetical protein
LLAERSRTAFDWRRALTIVAIARRRILEAIFPSDEAIQRT